MHHRTSSNDLASSGLPVQRVSPAAALAAASGGTGRIYQTRRGSFMILVVGTLALLAVITVLYVGIGRSDRQGAAAQVRKSTTEEIPEFFKEYARGVIGEATTALSEVPKPPFTADVPDAQREFIRKSWDYPDTAWSLRTYETNVNSRFYFKPSGHYSGSTPFLASSTPTWLNSALNAPPNSDPAQIYKNHNDWAHISNFAPDGAFVNLYNLRSDATNGGFDAPPSMMRRYVGLLDPSYGQVNTREFGGTINLVGGLPGNPAEIDSRRAFLFRETKLGNREFVNADNSQYMPYLYADADGDGKYDSAWIELRDWRDQSSQAFTSLLPQDPNYRWFFAARCVDLSGRVNVNTATDFFNTANPTALAPDAAVPIGVTPAEVDLFRLLSLNDAQTIYDRNYDSLNQYIGPTTNFALPAENYSVGGIPGMYDPALAFRVARRSYSWIEQSFNDVSVHNAQQDINSPITFPDRTRRITDYVMKVGRREAIGNTGGASSLYQTAALFPVGDLVELLTYGGVNDPAVRSRFEAVVGARNNVGVFPPADAEAVSPDRSPLRDNRSLAVERDYVPLNPGGQRDAAVAQGRLQAEIDVRHNLTTESGAREIRGEPIVNPAFTSQAELATSATATTLSASAFKYDLQTLLETSTNASGSISGPALNKVFTGYADGLMPAISNPTLQSQIWRGQPGATANIRGKNRTRFYGYNWFNGPELPLLYSAFLTVNLADTYDEDSSPRCVTLLTNNAYRDELKKDYVNVGAALPGDEPAVADRIPKPFLVDQQNGASPQLANSWAHWTEGAQFDLNQGARLTGRLADNTSYLASTKAPAMNVYGLEAMPFITQVGAITVYTDAPGSAGGDSDTAGDANGDGVPDDGVTINGDLNGTNSDMVMRVVAFQLSNPFDTEIVLSEFGGASAAANAGNAFDAAAYPAIDGEKSFYYLEFAGKFYKLAGMVYENSTHTDYDNANGRLIPLKIAPKSSIVVYILDRSKKDILDKWKLLETGATLNSDKLEGWFASQFSSVPMRSQFSPVEIPEFKPLDVDPNINAGGGAIVRQAWKDPLNVASGLDHNTALLWRAVRAPQIANAPQNHEGQLANPTKLVYQRNSRLNDQLVDRYTSSRDLDHRLEDGIKEVEEAWAGAEVPAAIDFTNYNSGITISYYVFSRRPDSPDVPAMEISAIPAWCIQPKLIPVSGWTLHEDDDQRSTTVPKLGDFQQYFSAFTFGEWRDKTTAIGAGSKTLLDEIQLEALKRHTQPIGDANIAGVTRTFERATDEFYLNNRKFSNPGPSGTQSVRAMRLGDIFLPMCIGSFETPLSLIGATPTVIPQVYGAGGIQPTNHLSNLRSRWCTLSEALAVAIGYEQLTPGTAPPPPSPPEVATDIIRTFYTGLPPAGGPNPASRPVHDRGHLVLDDFVPFQDSNQAIIPQANTPVIFNRGGAANSDYTVGLGIPAALAVVDQFSLATTLLTDQTRSKPGLINLNTATRPVLACIPMLAPIAPQASLNQWWWTGPVFDQKTDVVATLLGYRDKGTTYVRTPSIVNPATAAKAFEDSSTTGIVDPVASDGRGIASQIKAIHEQPGLRSVGELLAVRNRNGIPFNDPSNIDFLGVGADAATPPTVDSSRVGVDSILHSTDGSTFVIDTQVGEYDQKLAIANGAFTASAVRSDYFAVYFVMQGYQRADTENLKAGDPMIPSIRRRFVVILDRSNVVKIGDKPRVLAFKELPN